MPRHTRRIGVGPNLFGATGWLFADLFIALAMGFLVADTVGYVQPPSAVHILPTPTPTATPIATPIPPRALDLKPITVNLQVNPSALLANDPAEIASIEQQVRSASGLYGRSAGLVLAFGGAADSSPAEGRQLAAKVDSDVLTGLGKQRYVFQTAVYREFFSLDTNSTSVSIDVYVFKQ